MNIHEIVIAVHDIDEAAKRYAAALDGTIDDVISYPQKGIEIDLGGIWVGDFRIAFAADNSGEGPVSRLLEKRGEGLSELCVQTDDLDAAMEKMKEAGFRFVSEEPQILRDYPWKDEVFSEVHVVFVHPASSNGVQIELQQWH